MHQIFHSPALTAEPADYERDFAQWIEHQAELLRLKDFERLDLINLVEEIEDMGKSIKHELSSRLEVLILHLLKCEFQPEHKSSSWTGSIGEQRSQISRKLKQSPSLKRFVMEYASECYEAAVIRAANDTGLPEGLFPRTLPYSEEQLLNMRYIP
ncbi:MAG TPA: DUF29 domain-containing protein [Telluria sp.]|jgi:hypothetical protein